MDIKAHRVSKDIPLPKIEGGDEASFTLCSRVYHVIKPKEMISIPTNIKLDLPIEYIGIITQHPQTTYSGIIVIPVVIGWNDREEIEVTVYNYLTDKSITLSSGDPLAMVFILHIDNPDPIRIVEAEPIKKIGGDKLCNQEL